MNNKEHSNEPVSDEEKRQALYFVHQELAERLGIKRDLIGQKISFGLQSSLSPAAEFELAKAKGFQVYVQTALQCLEELLPKIRTRGELDDLVRTMRADLERAPTIAREQLGEIKKGLARRGGPGRNPLLDPEKSTLACKEMLNLVGKGCTATEAIDQVAQTSPTLLGTKVGKGTLWKAWKDRKKYLA